MTPFVAERCVRSRAVAATCRACVDACPTDAIGLAGGDVTVSHADCVDCGVCGAVCPTEAFPELDAEPRYVLRCGDGVACVAALSTERLLALARGDLRLLVGAGECRAHAAHRLVSARVQAVAALLGQPLAFDDEPAVPEPERRRWLARLSRGTGVTTVDRAALDATVLRRRRVPDRRSATLTALAGASPGVALDFTSAKALDVATCTGCQRCVVTCPTGALTTSPLRDELRFDAAACVACGLCHDVCEPRALVRVPARSPVAGRVSLGRLRSRPCGECGVWYVADEVEGLCPRCAALDDEARELVGMPRRAT